jgi:hypothetical protein
MGPGETVPQEEAQEAVKRLKVLLLILAVLVVTYAIVSLSERRVAGPDPLFREFSAERAAGIYIYVGDTGVVLEKRDGSWMVPSEDSLPADPSGVEAILAKVASFSRNDRVSSNPEKRSLYQVDSAGVLVRIVDEEGDTTAAFVVGKVGPDYQSSYVRDTGSNDVILASGYLRSLFDRGERTWQDRLIFSCEPDDIAVIDIHRGEEEYVLSRGAGGEWYIAEPESAACRQQPLAGLVRMLAMLRCDNFAGRLPLPGSNVAGSDTTLGFTTTSGETHRLLFGSEDGNGFVHFVVDGSDIVYLLSRSKVNALVPPLEALLPEEPSPGAALPGKSMPGGGATGAVPGETIPGETAR